MPFCTQCGRQSGTADVFCANCGARQSAESGSGAPTAGSTGKPGYSAADPLAGLTPRTASILCYIPVVGWIPAVVVLAAKRFKTEHTVRFHAFQGLYVFAGWLVVDWVVRPLGFMLPNEYFHPVPLLKALIIGVSIFMMVKASHDEAYVLPVIGELAQRSALEQ